jgi:hypothetical protein
VEDADRFHLLGTYKTPRFRYGQAAFCEVRGEVTLVGLTDAPIPWPVGKRGRALSLVVSKGLARVVRDSAVSDRVVALAKAACVKLTLHTLGKGFGCRYAGKVSAQLLQKLMRHRNIKTTMDYYANVDEAVEEAGLGPRGRRDGPGQGTVGAQRNGSRNTETGGAEGGEATTDTTLYPNFPPTC